MQVIDIPVESIVISDDFVRTHLKERSILELAESLTDVGMLQPILVTMEDGQYQLVAGYRRLLAVKETGNSSIPAIILSPDVNVLQVQLVENLQREELNPLDKALAVRRFIQSGNFSKVEAGKKLGVPRTTLNEWLNLLEVEEKYQQAVLNNFYGGSSPLTISHISLAKRFGDKLNSSRMINVALDAIIYYKLTRSETKKALDLVLHSHDLSVEEAVRKVRLVPRQKQKESQKSEWSVETMVDFLAKSGQYMVKCKPEDLAHLNNQQRQELLRQSSALTKLLREMVQKVASDKKQGAS